MENRNNMDTRNDLTPIEALQRLAHLYMETWPENKDYAMAAYYAGQHWVNILAESDHELAETAKNSCFWDMIPLVCDDINKETLEQYELQPFDRDRFLEVFPIISEDSLTKRALEIGVQNPYISSPKIEREKILHFTDTMTVGEFRYFFDYLFDGKAEIRIFRSNRRQLDNVMIKDILNPDRMDELVLSDNMTVAEAEKKLSSCFVEGCFVDIYPRYGNYRITKDMQLKDIKHIGGKLHDSFDSKLCEKY